MEWISVKDRLPENSDPVLIFVEHKRNTGTVYGGVRYNTKSGKWICPFRNITHWMSFPDPPIE